jgi:hypothetical protein
LRSILFAVVATLIVAIEPSHADSVSKQIYYTKTTTGLTTPATYVFRFSIWNVGTAGDPVVNKVWEEEKSIQMTTAALSTYLGSVTPLSPEDFWEQYWVMTELKDTTSGTYTEVGKRTKMNIVPYAMYSVTADTAAAGGSVPSVTAGNGLTSTIATAGDVTLNVGQARG